MQNEGGPLETALQEEVSNHRKLHWSKAFVVSVTGKGAEQLHQVRIGETNESEPLMT